MDDELPEMPVTKSELEAWSTMEPPAGFADRVAGSWERSRGPVRSRRRVWAVAIPFLAVASLALVFGLWGRGLGSHGSREFTVRETLVLGGRGLAVAEAGTSLKWTVKSNGEAVVEQASGDVFYRVERGGPFVVRTAAGEARVQGTCFRVEVRPMRTTNSKWVQMGIGAAVSAAVLVTVYEGKVLLANEHGQTPIGAGDRAVAGAGYSPTLLDHNVPAATTAPSVGGGDLPMLSREELLHRDEMQRAELDKLRARVQQLEVEEGKAGKEGKAGDAKPPFFSPSKDELAQLAKECKLKWDMPSIGMQPQVWGPKRAEEYGLNEAERLEVNRVSADVNTHVIADLRAFYLEVTGDKVGAESLTPNALEDEIRAKSRERDVQEAFARIARERAGLQAPPVDLKSLPAVERMQRLLSGLGDAYEKELGTALGADRAHELRVKYDGWGSRSQSGHGCPP